MKPLNITQIAESVSRLESEASEVLSAVEALEENLRNLKTELRNFDKAGPLTKAITPTDVALLRVWLKSAKRAHSAFSSEPTLELDRLIDLLSEA